MSEAILTVDSAVKRYGKVVALDGVSLSVQPEETVGLLGANGAGKTTLIESIMGARTLDSGQISVLGMSPHEQRAECAKNLSLQPQGSALFRYLSVRESVELWAAMYPSPRTIDEVISEVGLDSKAKARVRTLSGGQQQRLRLALALVGDTQVVLFDEPTVGLDPVAREQVWDGIRTRAGRGAVLMATQMMDEAEALCDRVVILDEGRLIAQGSVTELLDEYAADGSISFKTKADVDSAAMNRLPGVVWASVRRVRGASNVRLVTENQSRTMAAIRSSLSGSAERIKTSSPSMADVYLRLVGKETTPAVSEEES